MSNGLWMNSLLTLPYRRRQHVSTGLMRLRLYSVVIPTIYTSGFLHTMPSTRVCLIITWNQETTVFSDLPRVSTIYSQTTSKLCSLAFNQSQPYQTPLCVSERLYSFPSAMPPFCSSARCNMRFAVSVSVVMVRVLLGQVCSRFEAGCWLHVASKTRQSPNQTLNL